MLSVTELVRAGLGVAAAAGFPAWMEHLQPLGPALAGMTRRYGC